MNIIYIIQQNHIRTICMHSIFVPKFSLNKYLLDKDAQKYLRKATIINIYIDTSMNITYILSTNKNLSLF